jgi:uncharacterized membrane protein YeaQ/YmgE (transglycosylase-associated protein family)
MGWLGTLFVGAVVGLTGCALIWRRAWKRYWMGIPLAAVCALLVKMLGNITGLFDDGGSAEWLAAVAAAIIATQVFGAVAEKYLPPRLPEPDAEG